MFLNAEVTEKGRGGDVLARPLKDGINYFSLDVGFLQDKKTRLIKGAFGAKGILILLSLLCSVYGENGYFKQWDDEDCVLTAETVGCGCTPELIGEVVNGCVKRSIFDERVFNGFGVLTSPGIQRRYLRAVSTYESIEIKEEYWLLDINNKKDVPASISKKITFQKVILQNNPVILEKNLINLQNNAQRKGKENKGEENKEKESGEEAPPTHALLGSFLNVKLSEAQMMDLKMSFENSNELIEKISEYLANAKRKYDNHYALIKKIAREDKWPQKVKVVNSDLEDITEKVPMPKEIKEKMGAFYKNLGGK